MTDTRKRFPAAALPVLRCPVCGESFSAVDRSVRCLNGHSYDVAGQGYLNLLPGGARPGTADTAEMVAARETFLASAHFRGLRRFVADVGERALTERHRVEPLPAGGGATPRVPGCVIEVGAGTAYYLAEVLDRFPGTVGLALDISKYAARRAARAHERAAAVVCDAWKHLPVVDACASLVLDIFAPRNPVEFRRVLRPDGVLLVVTPSRAHLAELVAALGLLDVDEGKPARLESTLGAYFRRVDQVEYEETLCLSRKEAAALAAMGPSAHHLQVGELAERLSMLAEPFATSVSVIASVYAPRPT